MPKKLKPLKQFVKECGSYAEASRRTGIAVVQITRWAKGQRMPCLPYRDLLASKGLIVTK